MVSANFEWQLWEQQKEQGKNPAPRKNGSTGQKLSKRQKHIVNMFKQWALRGGHWGHNTETQTQDAMNSLWDPQANGRVNAKASGLTQSKLVTVCHKWTHLYKVTMVGHSI